MQSIKTLERAVNLDMIGSECNLYLPVAKIWQRKYFIKLFFYSAISYVLRLRLKLMAQPRSRKCWIIL